jgi:hypothetical protein
MVVLRIGKNYNAIEVDQTRLPFQSRQDDINGTLESLRGILEAQGHPNKSVNSFVAGECRLVRI